LGWVSPVASVSETEETLAPPAGAASAATASIEVTALATRHRRDSVIGSSGAVRATRPWVSTPPPRCLPGRRAIDRFVPDYGAGSATRTTELPFVDALADHPELHYVLGLQENVVVAMADGYAQASGRPSFVNLHTVAALGGGTGNLTNALANRTPMVVTAGQQDRRHLLAEPILSGDLTGLARAATKWQHEVRHLGELAPVLRRAFLAAATPPTGPVFVSIPMDVLDEDGDVDVPPRSRFSQAAVAGGLEELAGLLAEAAPDGLALVVGDEVAAAGALAEVTALAEVLGARVHGAPLHSNLDFPTDHPLWSGMLGFSAAAVSATLSRYRRIFVIGAKAFLVYPWTPPSPLPPGAELLHLAADPTLVGRDLPTRFGTAGHIAASLQALVPLVRARVDRAAVDAALGRARATAAGAWE